MNQCDIYWADLEPSLGHEQGGVRPVVVISGNTMNHYLKIAMVCSLSSQIKGFHGSVIIKKSPGNGLDCDSEVLPFQLRTISEKRLLRKIGSVSKEELARIIIGVQQLLII